jgi:exo-beta-1,3-glucanase (GH17 family)
VVGALLTVLVGDVYSQAAPTFFIQLNQTTYGDQDTMVVTATLLPGAVLRPVDAYIFVEAPDGSVYSVSASGQLVSGTVPIVRGLTPVSFTGAVFSATITPSVPRGAYRWRASLTEPGTLDLVTTISVVPFSVVGGTQGRVLSGLSFSPWLAGENPHTGTVLRDEQIRSRLEVVAPYTRWVRLSGSRSGLEEAPRHAHAFGLRVACAAALGNDTSANELELQFVRALGRTGLCDLVIVGSETLHGGLLTAVALREYIEVVKSGVIGVPVTTSETTDAWLANPSLLLAVDVVFVRHDPFREGVALEKAVANVENRHAQVVAAAGGKLVMAESGWPTCGSSVGDAQPSQMNAMAYASSLIAWSRARGVQLFYEQAFDEPWRSVAEGPSAACWGIWDSRGVIKPGMLSLLALR